MKLADAARFWSRVDHAGDDDCWLWKGSRTSHGYGSFSISAHTRTAHRLSWEYINGPIPDGLVIDHLCRVRHCVNPAHMELVSNGENVLRGEGPTARHARLTHCKHGHPFDEQNTRWRNNRRVCIACREDYERRRREERALAPADRNTT